MIGIYCIENTCNNKKYIGQTTNTTYRFRNHKHSLKTNIQRNSHLQNAWNKYGKENFKFFIIQECEETSLNLLELYWITFYNTLSENEGYNIKEAGGNGRHSEESKKKMSYSRKGKKHSKSRIKNISKALTGRALSETHKANVKKNHADVSSSNNPNFGKKKKNSSSLFFGVCKHKTTGRWEVTTCIDGKSKYIGLFNTEIDAAEAYDSYIIKNNLPNPLNFPILGKEV